MKTCFIMTGKLLSLALPVLAMLLVCGVVWGQDEDVIRVNADVVAVPVSVLDRSGKYISTLKQGDFRIFEDGIEQEVTLFETVENYVTVIMLIERAGSREYQLPRVVAAANAFVRQMRPEDTLVAMTYGSDPETVIDRKKIKDVPKGIVVGRQAIDKFGISLFGTVDKALKMINKIPGRKAIVLFSQGTDSDRYRSKSAKGTLKDAEESEATIYTIKIGSGYIPPKWILESKTYKESIKAADDYMTGLALRSGGRAFQVDRIEQLDAQFAEVANELVKQYMLGYSPARVGSNGEKRKITVKVNYPEAVVRARKEVIYKKTK